MVQLLLQEPNTWNLKGKGTHMSPSLEKQQIISLLTRGPPLSLPVEVVVHRGSLAPD